MATGLKVYARMCNTVNGTGTVVKDDGVLVWVRIDADQEIYPFYRHEVSRV